MKAKFIACLISFATLVACNSSYQAPVGQLGDEPAFIDSGRMHRVNSGETLYAISWVYDLNFSEFARANNLVPPYTIYPGQNLLIDLRNVPPQISRQSSTQSRAPTIARSNTSNTRSTASNTPTASPPTTRVSNTPSQASSRTVNLPSADIRWGWPNRGDIIARFSASGVENKGIDIAGSGGEAILAAAAGEVVYAGSGLLRYGDLIIIKHNDEFLSAYAHNKTLNVREGDAVRIGQKIAELGSTGIDRTMLHFEIRLSGKPVDPMRYLPTL